MPQCLASGEEEDGDPGKDIDITKQRGEERISGVPTDMKSLRRMLFIEILG